MHMVHMHIFMQANTQIFKQSYLPQSVIPPVCNLLSGQERLFDALKLVTNGCE